MRHDPDRLAAEFLSGDLAGARRRLVERHLLDCDECWWEVAQARQGRHAAEALRLVTPPPPPRLRDKPTGSSGPRPGASFSSANRSSCTSTAAPTAPGSCWLARRSSSHAPPARTTCRAGNGRPTSAESGSTAPPDPDR